MGTHAALACRACLVLTLGGAGAVAAQDIVAVPADTLGGAWFVPSDSARTHVELVVRAGERDNVGAPGLAHYVEHLAWLSAVTPPGAARGDGGGADSNATTALTATRYWLDGPPEALDTMLATLARVLRPIALPEAFAHGEIGIVRSEYELRFRDSPDASLRQDMGRLQHGEQWPAQSVIGTPGSIASFTPEAARAFQARTYRAGGAVLLVEGRHDETALATTARAGFPRDNFERARQYLLDELDSLEKPALAVRDDVSESIVEGMAPISLPARRAALAAVTLDEVNALLRAFADAPRTVTLLVTPGTDR